MINGLHLIGQEDEAAGSYQDKARQLGKKDCIRTYIKVFYSCFYAKLIFGNLGGLSLTTGLKEGWLKTDYHVHQSSGNRVT